MMESLSRREFFKAAGRWLLAAGIGAAALRLASGRPSDRQPRLTGQTCANQGVCRGCGVFRGCGLPQALSARQRASWARGR